MRHKRFTVFNPIKAVRSNLTGLKLSVVLFLVLGLTGLQAQESLNATGSNALGSGGSVSYSVGQVAYQTHTGTSGSVVEGVQQPYEISVVTGIEDAKGINLSISVYPNPTSDYLTLSIDEDVKTGHDFSFMSYQLYDMQGKLLLNEKITDNPTSINMEHLVPAIYYIKVIKKTQGFASQEVETFKIIKN